MTTRLCPRHGSCAGCAASRKPWQTPHDFFAGLEVSGECWLYPSRERRTYVRTRWEGRSTYAHRIAWELANGPIPDGLWVLHRCDTPRCCRPDHLFLGTTQDNTADMMAKGRGPIGARNRNYGKPGHTPKLTAEQVKTIRNWAVIGYSYAALAREYKVTPRAIRLIALREVWKHLK